MDVYRCGISSVTNPEESDHPSHTRAFIAISLRCQGNRVGQFRRLSSLHETLIRRAGISIGLVENGSESARLMRWQCRRLAGELCDILGDARLTAQADREIVVHSIGRNRGNHGERTA
jgi:hypothetical protein